MLFLNLWLNDSKYRVPLVLLSLYLLLSYEIGWCPTISMFMFARLDYLFRWNYRKQSNDRESIMYFFDVDREHLNRDHSHSPVIISSFRRLVVLRRLRLLHRVHMMKSYGYVYVNLSDLRIGWVIHLSNNSHFAAIASRCRSYSHRTNRLWSTDERWSTHIKMKNFYDLQIWNCEIGRLLCVGSIDWNSVESQHLCFTKLN